MALVGYDEPTGARLEDPFLDLMSLNDDTMLPLWSLSRVRDQAELFHSVAVRGDRIAVGGEAGSGDGVGAFVVVFNRDPAQLWEMRVSTRPGSRIVALELLPDGDVIWVANLPTPSGPDFAVGRLEGSTGEPIWSTRFDNGLDESAADLLRTSDGRLLVVGNETHAARGDQDLVVVILDENGVELDSAAWGTGDDESAVAAAVDACGQLVIAGHRTAGRTREAFLHVSPLAR
jgi:outer membrane protein assembly factor BamB